MLAAKASMQGHVVGMAVWAPFADAPAGQRVHVLRRSGKEQKATLLLGRWWRIPFLLKLKEGGADPVTHFHA